VTGGVDGAELLTCGAMSPTDCVLTPNTADGQPSCQPATARPTSTIAKLTAAASTVVADRFGAGLGLLSGQWHEPQEVADSWFNCPQT